MLIVSIARYGSGEDDRCPDCDSLRDHAIRTRTHVIRTGYVYGLCLHLVQGIAGRPTMQSPGWTDMALLRFAQQSV